MKLDLDYLRGQIRDNHIDAVVVSRLLNVDKKVTVVPSSTYIAPYPYYYSFYGYLGAVYPMVYDPGYTREDTTVSVETNVYATSKPDGDLLWNGVSRSFNPKSAKKIADGLVKEVPKHQSRWRKTGCYRKESPRTNYGGPAYRVQMRRATDSVESFELLDRGCQRNRPSRLAWA